MSPAIGAGPSQHRATTLKGGGPVGTTISHNSSKSYVPDAQPRIYPHIDDLTRVEPGIKQNASMRTILESGEALAKRADTDYDFKRLDLALKNYIMALILWAEVVPRHQSYPDLRSERARGGELWRLWTGLQKRLQSQEQKFDAVKALIKEDNLRSGVRPASEGRATDAVMEADGKKSTTNLLRGPKNDETSSNDSTDSGYGGSLDLQTSNQTRRRPAIHPKPAALHGNAIQQGHGGASSGDLAARFARLRSSDTATPVQDPRIRTRPIEISESKLDTTSPKPADVPSRPILQPAGPREMPAAPKTPLKAFSAKIEMPSMPKPPAAIYTPSQSTDSATTNDLPSSNPRGTSFYGSRSNTLVESPQPASSPVYGDGKDYFAAAHTASSFGGPVRSRKSIDLPDSATITARELLQYQQKGVRILVVDLRDRAEFDNGHIMSQTIICIDPIIPREEMSADRLGECLVLSPEAEQKLYEQRAQFDLIVFYDQSSRSIPSRYSSGVQNALKTFPQIIFEHAYEKQLTRRPVLLVGGIDSWVDLVSLGSLQTSKTNLQVGISDKGLGRKAAAQSLIRHRQISISRPLSKSEEEKWDKTLTHGESLETSNVGEDGLTYARTTEDIFSRKFPPIDVESMTEPSSSSTYDSIAVPTAPTRPPPALPRHKSSGILERAHTASHNLKNGPPTLASGHMITPGETGLQNFTGNICYMNSSIQALSHTPAISFFLRDFKFVQAGTRLPRKSDETSDPPQLMIRFLGNLIGHMWSGQFDFVAPKSFSHYVRAVHAPTYSNLGYKADTCFGSDTQHDAEEFLHWLLAILEDESNPSRNQIPYQQTARNDSDKQTMNTLPLPILADQELRRLRRCENSPITHLCRFMSVQTLTCLRCWTPSRTVDSGPIMSLTIEDTGDLHSAILKEYRPDSAILRDSNAYKCDKCNCHTQAAKGLTFIHLPEYLIIALNRAKQTVSGQTAKRSSMVTFPEVLDMTPYYRIPAVRPSHNTAINALSEQSTEDLRYECYAVIQHQGSLNSGHYWTIARSPIGARKAKGGKLGAWMKFNDQKVSRSHWNATQTKESMIMFYRKKGSRGEI